MVKRFILFGCCFFTIVNVLAHLLVTSPGPPQDTTRVNCTFHASAFKTLLFTRRHVHFYDRFQALRDKGAAIERALEAKPSSTLTSRGLGLAGDLLMASIVHRTFENPSWRFVSGQNDMTPSFS